MPEVLVCLHFVTCF